ncbi:TNF receptor-associated factor 5-like [Corticium candelabrum]|uniref:TNF receptor-associated factor 5-like n=1 Tax=Corticium candelabrum TaxID=121492 RepID=UPI002E2698B1|nr:TNF receptor-associated factor 5-like [Corticium candelabrum]
MVIRKDMDNHKQNECNHQIVGCCYCDTQLEYGQLTVHYEMCDSYPVDCPYECGMQVARKDMEMHVSREGVCPTSPLQCDVASAGCQFIGNREQLQDHLEKNTAYHLSLAMQTVSNVQERFASAGKKQAETDNELVVVKKTLQKTDNESADGNRALQQTETSVLAANYKTFSKLLGGERLEKDDQKQSVEYVKALLDKRIQFHLKWATLLYTCGR